MPRTPTIMRSIGRTGLQHSGGVVFEEFLIELSGERGKRVIREMAENDPVVGGVLFAIRSIITGVQWDILPAGKDNASQRAADLVRTSIHDMETPFEDVLSDVLSFLPYGFALEEITYKMRQGEHRNPMKDSRYDDGLISWADWAPRSQNSVSRWDFDGDRVNGVYQGDGTSEIFIPETKLLHFKTGVYKGNPEGRSILRSAYRPWYYKKWIETIEAIGLERDLTGLPVGMIPADYFDEENRTAGMTATYNAILKGLQNVRNDEEGGMLFPSDRDEHGHLKFEFKLMASPGERQFETSNVIERYDTRILMSVLADFIILGHEAVGSFALSNDKTNLFAVAMGSIMNLMARTLNKQAIRPLMRVNNIPIQQAPTMKPRDIETNSLDDLGTYIWNLNRSGFNLTDLDTENYLRGQANLPRVTEMNRESPSEDAGSVPNEDDSGANEDGSEPNEDE